MKKNTHGGKREGAGRKKREQTKAIRVPVALIPAINKLISDYKDCKKSQQERVMDACSSNFKKWTKKKPTRNSEL